jgi:hypothetical protein
MRKHMRSLRITEEFEGFFYVSLLLVDPGTRATVHLKQPAAGAGERS